MKNYIHSIAPSPHSAMLTKIRTFLSPTHAHTYTLTYTNGRKNPVTTERSRTPQNSKILPSVHSLSRTYPKNSITVCIHMILLSQQCGANNQGGKLTFGLCYSSTTSSLGGPLATRRDPTTICWICFVVFIRKLNRSIQGAIPLVLL